MSCDVEISVIQGKLIPQPGSHASMALFYSLRAREWLERSTAMRGSRDHTHYLLRSKMWCLCCMFYPFAGSHKQAPHLHWRRAFFLKVVTVVTTEDGVNLNPAATRADGEVWDYSDHSLYRGEYSFSQSLVR